MIVDHPLPNFYSGWKSPPWVIVLHYTAGYTARQCADALEKQKLSVHATIERDGTIYRHVKDGDRAIHAGYGRWAGVSGMNSHSLGIEMVNFGWADGKYEGTPSRKYDNDKSSPDDPELMVDLQPFYRREVYGGKEYAILTRAECGDFVDHRTNAPLVRGEQESIESLDSLLWARYPAEQISAVLLQTWAWVVSNNILLENVVGHEHITPHRKMDPGPAFPWQHFSKQLRSWASTSKPELLDWTVRTDEKVKAVQSHCDRMGFSLGAIDGDWGPKTSAAVEAAIAKYGSTYKFSRYGHLTPYPACSLALCDAFRHVPGFDPGRS
jgi:N-acetyl-anhydromuramyl-L-alanine amidase AmpD